MGYTTRNLRRVLARACSPLALALSLAAAPALAQTASAPVNLDLGAVLSTGTGNTANLINTPGTAPYEAPSVAPLNASQPTSVVTKHIVDNLLTPTESWADIARLTPSVNTIDPNGPGLMETTGPSIRGFQDGQYNVTFDGIPIGDSNDFTHHSTSFFTNSEIDQTIVDRGPGTAETVGDATFGGTVSIRTINPAPIPAATLNASYGSYDTSDGSVRLDTGSIAAADGTSAVFDAEHIKSNGALQNATQERSNFFGKVVIPVNSNTTITLLSDYNNLYQNPPLGATTEQMAAYGWNYAYNTDPNSQGYNRYNDDHITTDMDYIDLKSNLGGGFRYEGNIYTYAYYHHDLNGDDPSDVIAGGVENAAGNPNEVVLTPGGNPIIGAVPGEVFKNDYRSVGTIQRLEDDFDWGDIKAGAWFDHQVNTRYVQEVSLTNGNAINYDPSSANGCQGTVGNDCTAYSPPNPNPYDNDLGTIARLQHNQLYTFQPYGQLDWQPLDGLTVTGGAKWAYFRRALDAQVQQKTGQVTGYTHNWQKLLPSFEVKYAFTPNISAYVQGAEGFLAPNLNTFYVKAINQESYAPQSTINFQGGLAYQDEHWALSGDLYTIHFQNFIGSTTETVPGFSVPQKVFINQGGAIYRGVEGEAAYSFGDGVTLFGNAGYNQAYLTIGHVYITEAPQGTANLGAIYDANGIYGSIVDQWTGGEYSGDGADQGFTGAYADSPAGGKSPGGWYDPYNVVNATLAYTFYHDDPNRNPVKVKLNLDNITNQKQVIFDAGANTNNDLLYDRLTGFAAFASVSVPVNF